MISEKSNRLSHMKNMLLIAFVDEEMDENMNKMITLLAKKNGITQEEINEAFENPDNIEFYIPRTMKEKLIQLHDLVTLMILGGPIKKEEMLNCKIIAINFGLDDKIIENFIEKIMYFIKSGEKRDIISETLLELGYPTVNTLDNRLGEVTRFISKNLIRYEYDYSSNGKHFNCHRYIKIEKNISDEIGYTVSIDNLDEDGLINNNHMSPKQMHILTTCEEIITLKGFGLDIMGAPFSDYGISLLFENKNLNKVILHLYDRNIDMEYL